MPSIFHWKPKKLAVRLQHSKKEPKVNREEEVVVKNLEEKAKDLNPIEVKRSDSTETTSLPYIDRSSSPSTVNFPLNPKREGVGLREEDVRRDHLREEEVEMVRQESPQRHYSPQRQPYLNNNNINYNNQNFDNHHQLRDYFPRHEHNSTYGANFSRVQRNVRFDDEEGDFKYGGLGSNQNSALSGQQSSSTPATPIISNREPFVNQNNFRPQLDGNPNKNQLDSSSTQNNIGYQPPNHLLDQQVNQNYSNQDSNQLHNYPPPPYSSTTAANAHQSRFPSQANPIDSMTPQKLNPYRQASPQSPLGERRLSARASDPHETYFASDIVPPRPPRQQQAQPLFQRSNSAGSGSNAGGGPRPQQHVHQNFPKENRANLILQQLRGDDGAQSESDVSTNEPMYAHNQANRMSFGRSGVNNQSFMNSKGVVYLEFNKEVKRSTLPTRLCTHEQIKSLFLRSFPSLTLQFLNQEHVKIYIADRQSGISGGENVLFYELEDLNDVKDQTVLKIHQSQVYRSPPPQSLQFTNQPPTDYISEPEADERTKRYASYHRARPASALPETSRMLSQYSSVSPSAQLGQPQIGKLQIAKQGPLSSHHFEAYYDPYYSDASSQGPRSGSVTPIIDKETRQRVETMERQLAGLSTLVRSALVQQKSNKDGSPDMFDLGRRLLEMQSDAAERFGIITPTSNSNSSSMYATFMNGKQLLQVKRGVRDMRINLNELRDFVEIDKQSRSDLIRDTFKNIVAYLEEFTRQQSQNNVSQNKNDLQLKKQKGQYQLSIKALEDSIQNLENKIENRRIDVLSKNQKLRMAEVDGLNFELRSIDQQTNQIREQYMELEDEACKLIDHYKEAIDEQADFLRQEPSTMENCGRRCTALQNIMQDPSLYDGNKALLNTSDNQPNDKVPPKVAPKPNGTITSNGILHASNGVNHKNEQLPPLPHSPQQRVTSPNPIRSVTATSNGHSAPPLAQTNANVLDSILDELNNTANSLPKILGDQNSGQLLNGKTPKSAKQVVEASATLTLKEPNNQTHPLKTSSTNITAEKYDNLNEEHPPAQNLVKFKLNPPASRVSASDPRKRFVTTESVKFRPTNSGHVVLTSNGRP